MVWNGRVSGFTKHTFSADFGSLTTDFIGVGGSVLHSFVVDKAGTPPSPPSPPSGGSCKAYGCDTYKHGAPCQCNSKCEQYKDCCDDYETLCSHDEV